MSILGVPAEWVDLIDPMVPQILELVISTWNDLPSPGTDAREDDITTLLCKALCANRTARGLMFQIHTQQVELDPVPGEDMGRLDLAFSALVPREDIYFCLECKRLNVRSNGHLRAYASEYVTLGMKRFITGQYSRAVRHGGMLGYVLDGDVARARSNIEENVEANRVALKLVGPELLRASSVLPHEERVSETHHRRAHDATTFRIHHVLMARTG